MPERVAEIEHVHDVSCLEQGCASLYATEPRRRSLLRRPPVVPVAAAIACAAAVATWGLAAQGGDAPGDSGVAPGQAVPAPDFTGLTDDEASSAARASGFELVEQADPGSGDDAIDAADVVRWQVPAPGAMAVAGREPLRVFYGPP